MGLTLIDPTQIKGGSSGTAISSTRGIFTQIAPPENLSPSLRTATLAPVPPGINGTDTAHYVGIFNNAGTWLENVLINGGTAVSGAATGTVTFAAISGTYTTGNYKIGSSTAGIKEALQYAAPGHGRVVIPGGSYTIYSLIDIPASTSLRGSGIANTVLTMATGYVGRAMQALSALTDIGDFSIEYTTNGTSDAGLYMAGVTDAVVENLRVVHSYNGITGINIARVHYIGVNLFPLNDGYNFSSTGINVSVPTILGGSVDMVSSPTGAVVRLGPTIAGMKIIGLNSGFGQYGLVAVASSGAINEVDLIDCTIDGNSGFSVYVALTGSATATRWQVSNNKFAATPGGTGGMFISTATAGNISGFVCQGNTILGSNAAANGLNLQGISGGLVADNMVNNNVAGGNGILIDGYACTDLLIEGNVLGLGLAYTSASGAAYGIFINTQAHSAIVIRDNTLVGSTAALLNGSTVAGGVKWYNNTGIDDVVPTVASATSTASPINPSFKVSGTTTITTITGGFIGRRIHIMKTDAGSVTIGGGGNIPGSHTLAQNGGLDLVNDGTNWY